MAYRHFNGAPYLQCWSDGAHVYVQELDGWIHQLPFAFGKSIDPQVTPQLTRGMERSHERIKLPQVKGIF